MTKTCVICPDGRVQIGEWDDMGGTNPIPEGAIIEEREVAQDEDGGWYVLGIAKPPSINERLQAAEDAITALLGL